MGSYAVLSPGRSRRRECAPLTTWLDQRCKPISKIRLNNIIAPCTLSYTDFSAKSSCCSLRFHRLHDGQRGHAANSVPFHTEANVVKLFAQVAVGKELAHHDGSRHVTFMLSNTPLQDTRVSVTACNTCSRLLSAPASCSGVRPSQQRL